MQRDFIYVKRKMPESARYVVLILLVFVTIGSAITVVHMLQFIHSRRPHVYHHSAQQ